MSDKALGLIETVGLIGAIEAADAAAKAAAVVVASVELTEGTLMTLKIYGDLGAVQAAVEAGSEAAQKVGELLTAHVIPNPDSGLDVILPPRRFISKYHPDDNRTALGSEDAENDMPVKPKATPEKPTKPKRQKDDSNLNNMTVSELRQIARSLDGFPLKGREISIANKNQLIDAIKKFKDEDK